jgi:hypothetical protein
MGRTADAVPLRMDHPVTVEAGDGAEVREIEDVLDRLEIWHRGSAPVGDRREDDRSEAAGRR